VLCAHACCVTGCACFGGEVFDNVGHFGFPFLRAGCPCLCIQFTGVHTQVKFICKIIKKSFGNVITCMYSKDVERETNDS
jgi:hypothetical protein